MARQTQQTRDRKTQRPVIGWREWLALPGFGVDRIKVKVDTGARSSSLHAFDIETFSKDGEEWIAFSIHPKQRDDRTSLRVEAPVHDRRKVRPSTGKARIRPVVLMPVTLGDATWLIEINLVRRDMMGFRMLLGRQAVRGRYLVDAGRSYLAGEPRLEAASDAGPRVRPTLSRTGTP